MTLDPDKIFQAKREFHQRQAARPIVEKLAMLDALRERELAIRASRRLETTAFQRPKPLTEAG